MDGTELTFTSSGFTYDRQFILYDVETGGLWFHLPGSDDLTCIGGTYAGRLLKAIESTYGPWHAWHEQNPGTRYLKPIRDPR